MAEKAEIRVGDLVAVVGLRLDNHLQGRHFTVEGIYTLDGVSRAIIGYQYDQFRHHRRSLDLETAFLFPVKNETNSQIKENHD